MTTQNEAAYAGCSLLIFHFKLVGKVALIAGALSFGVLLAVLVFISDPAGESYWRVVRSHSITRQSLATSLLLAGCLLVLAVAFITWLFSLYASFRIAGPLYRFARNLEQLSGGGTARLVPIRQDDQLQEEANKLQEAAQRLADHYRHVAAAADRGLAAVAAADAGELARAVTKLRELDSRVRC
jgi:HAMP domain-containing protein